MRCAFACVLFAALCLMAGMGQAEDRLPGSAFMSPALRALQNDPAANPALLSIMDGQALWTQKAGAQDTSCAACHGDAADSMRGVAARYPAPDKASGKVMTLAQKINQCRNVRQQATAYRAEDQHLLALAAYLFSLSDGMPIAPPSGGAMTRTQRTGKQIYQLRQGQLNLSCAQCHDDHAGRHLAGAAIPQAHPTGYPIYRLEWQAMGSLQRRLRGCLAGVRARLPEYDSDQLVALEAYLMMRAKGMKIEAAAIRP